jgi:hypothetical protein
MLFDIEITRIEYYARRLLIRDYERIYIARCPSSNYPPTYDISEGCSATLKMILSSFISGPNLRFRFLATLKVTSLSAAKQRHK